MNSHPLRASVATMLAAIANTPIVRAAMPPRRDFLASYSLSLSIKCDILETTVASISSKSLVHTPTTLAVGVEKLLCLMGSKVPYNWCAFAGELHAWPRSRNGYNRIRAYEDHDTSAFALMETTSS